MLVQRTTLLATKTRRELQSARRLSSIQIQYCVLHEKVTTSMKKEPLEMLHNSANRGLRHRDTNKLDLSCAALVYGSNRHEEPVN